MLGNYQSVATDSSREHRGGDCAASTLDCLLDIIRSLRMGSCLSGESRSPPPPPNLGVGKRKNSRKRLEYGREPLHKIPGRSVLNGSSDAASLFTQQGKKGVNQDAMIVWENFGSRTDTILCGVFDGHGPHGHMVAKRVRDSLPLKLSAQWEVNVTANEVLKDLSLSSAGDSFISVNEDARLLKYCEETEKHPEIFHTLKESFLKAYKLMDRELKLHTTIDSFCSGTTAVTLVKQGQHLVIGNIGDSRAVLGTRDEENCLLAVQLTVDLKPNLPAEAERIRKRRGRVFALKDEPGVVRVWLPNNFSPGLAMARAFGDFCLKDFGLISVPEVTYRHLSDKDDFIVLATDGIWDVLSNQEVVDIVASTPNRSSAARAVVESAVRGWKSKYPTSKVDDCAAICLFLDSNSSKFYAASNSNTEKDQVDSSSGKDSGAVSIPNGMDEEITEEDMSREESGTDWSALEGVARVDTILTLPRFVP